MINNEILNSYSKEKQEEILSLDYKTITKNSRMIDKTGEKYGDLLVLGPAKSNQRGYWWVICNACNEQTIFRVRTDGLQKRTKCPKCSKKEVGKKNTRPQKDLTNQKFNRLTALYYKGNSKWHCRCECGNELDVVTSSLLNNNTKSCGCLKKENSYFTTHMKKDLVGNVFGKLTVIEDTGKRYCGKIIWKCKCECGNITEVVTGALTSGNTQSCGCAKISGGARKLEEFLKLNNFIYIKEYTTNDLHYKRFDFALLNEQNEVYRLIEFDGEQHFRATGGWNNKENHALTLQRDQEKNQWALEHNIPLVRIPYWERDNITLEMILGDQYLISPLTNIQEP